MPDDTRGQSNPSPLDGPSKVTAGMLIVGWGVAIAVYATAAPDEDNPLYEFEQSKKYLLDVERVGGKTAVFSSEIRAWFSGLWHGQSLAFTIATLTTVIALGYLYAAHRRLSSGQ